MKDETKYDRYPVYRGDDLELTYSPEGSSFRLWAPSAERGSPEAVRRGRGRRSVADSIDGCFVRRHVDGRTAGRPQGAILYVRYIL